MKKIPASRKVPGPSMPPDGAGPDAAATAGTTPAPEAEISMIRCTVCGSDTQAGSVEQMCWVCRRLKISAWRDVEQQIPAQE